MWVAWATAGLSLLPFAAALSLAAQAASGAEPPTWGITMGPLVLDAALRADSLASLVLLCVAAVAALTLWLSPGLGKPTRYRPTQLRRYQIFVNLFIAMMLLAVAASVVGETVIDLKIRLYFTHKGTEKLFEGRTPDAGVELAERISGDTTIGHSLAYCQALEALAGCVVPPRARYLRVVLLEMERLYNHVADFGMICNDTGFAFAHSQCFRIRERLLRLNKRLSGNRLLRSSIVPGGVGHDLPADLDLAAEIDAAVADFDEVVAIALANSMVRDRLENAGHCLRPNRYPAGQRRSGQRRRDQRRRA